MIAAVSLCKFPSVAISSARPIGEKWNDCSSNFIQSWYFPLPMAALEWPRGVGANVAANDVQCAGVAALIWMFVLK